MIRGLLLDLDNTLIDRDGAVARWLARVAPGSAADLVAIDRGGHGPRRRFFAAIGAAIGTSPTDARRRFADEVPPTVTLEPAAARLLGAFTGPKVLVTNGAPDIQRAKISAANVTVDHVLISGELGVEKPRAEIFHRALACAGVSADEALMIGDHPRNDVDGARAVGIAAILLRTRWFTPRSDDRVIDDLDEVRW